MNVDGKLVIVKVLVVLGFAFTSCSLTLGIVTYVVPAWFLYSPAKVKGDVIPEQWLHLPRVRGIFQECSTVSVPGVNPGGPFILKNDCFDNDIGQYPTMYNLSDPYYMMIIRMRQSQLIVHGISLLLSLFTLLIGLGIILKWYCTSIETVYYIRWRLSIGLISIIIFLTMATSCSLGTGLAIVENSSTYKTASLPQSLFNQPNVTTAFWNMYILAWVSSAFSLLAAMFLLISVCLGTKLEKLKYKPQVLSAENPTFTGDDNKCNTNIFLEPSMGSSTEMQLRNPSPNEVTSPGLLPRFSIKG